MASAGDRHTVLLRSDGKVAVAGSNVHGQCNMKANRGPFKQVSAGGEHTLVLSSKGDVMAFGSNQDFQCSLPRVKTCKDGPLEYVQVSAGHKHSVALRSDGKVLYAGKEYGGDEMRLVPMDLGMASEVCEPLSPRSSSRKAARSLGMDSVEDRAIELEYSALDKPYDFIEPFDTSDYEKGEASSLWELRPTLLRFSGFLQSWDIPAEPENNVVFLDELAAEPKGYEIRCSGHSKLRQEATVAQTHSQVMTPPVSPRKAQDCHKALASAVQPKACDLSNGGSQSSSEARHSPRTSAPARRSFGLVSPSRFEDILDHYQVDDENALAEHAAIELEYSALDSSESSQHRPQNFAISDEELDALRSSDEGCVSGATMNYVQVSAGHSHTALLRSDGRAIAFGVNESGQCTLPQEAEYEQVSAGGFHTVLLHKNGDAVARGSNSHHQCDLPTHCGTSPRGYMRVSAGRRHTVLLRRDGRVEAVGCNTDGQCDIPPLEVGVKYVQASAGGYHTALLRSDGQAVTVGAEGDISIPAVQQHQTWADWLLTKPTLPDCVEYVSDLGELPVGTLKSEEDTL